MPPRAARHQRDAHASRRDVIDHEAAVRARRDAGGRREALRRRPAVHQDPEIGQGRRRRVGGRRPRCGRRASARRTSRPSSRARSRAVPSGPPRIRDGGRSRPSFPWEGRGGGSRRRRRWSSCWKSLLVTTGRSDPRASTVAPTTGAEDASSTVPRTAPPDVRRMRPTSVTAPATTFTSDTTWRPRSRAATCTT